MGKFDGILICSDFDGTLAHKAQISDANRDAVRYFQSEGGLFAVASGRAPSWLPKWRERFVPNTWSATFNGAILCDAEGKELYMLANSGCLNNCSAHVFHDNLVAHEAQIAGGAILILLGLKILLEHLGVLP